VLLSQVLRDRRLAPVGTAVLVTWLVCVAASRVLWPPPFERFQILRDRVRFFRGMIEGKIRSAAPGSAACVPNQAVDLSAGFPGFVGIFMLYHRDDAFEGRRVYFTTSDPKVLALRIPGSRTKDLLLPDGQCPPAPGPGDTPAPPL
jgi:hypothetical protein